MGLIVFLIFIWLIVMSYNVFSLKKRIGMLEKQLRQQAAAPAPATEQTHSSKESLGSAQTPAPESAPSAHADDVLAQALTTHEELVAAAMSEQAQAQSTPAAQAEAPLSSSSPLMSFVRRNAFAVAGVILLLLGFAYC